MLKHLRKIVIVGVALMGAVVAHGATTRYVELRSTLQPNTTGLNAINVSSGSIKNFSASTATVTGPLTVTGLSTLGSATVTGTATLATLAGAITDTSTTTHNGGHTFSTMTVTDARFLAMTVSGTIKDRSLSSGTTWDYMLGGSSSTWSHAGLFVQQLSSSDAVGIATTLTSFTNTKLGITITPKFTTSKLILEAYASGDNNANGGTCYVTISKGNTSLSSTANGFAIYNNVTARVALPIAVKYVDSALTSGTTTYWVQIKSNGTGTCTFGENVEQDWMYATEVGQ